MSNIPTAASAGQEWPFKTPEELEAFLKRVITEEAPAAMANAIRPLTERQATMMTEMLAAERREASTPPGLLAARFVRAQALTFKETGRRDDPEAIKSTVAKFWGKDDPVMKGVEGSIKLAKATAAQASDPTSLGNLIVPQWSQEIIALLRNWPVVRSIARVIPNPSGSLTFRRMTSGGIGYWVGEGAPAITPSKPGAGLMNFVRKKLAGLVVLSNDLLRYASFAIDQEIVLPDMLKVLALAEDLAYLRADGTQYQPRGIRSLVNAAHVFAQSGTGLADIDVDYAKAMRLLEEANLGVDASDDELHWLMVPRTWFGLWNAKPATDAGARPYRDELKMRDFGSAPWARTAKGRVLGAPVHKTNQIPKNLGGGGNESETMLVHGPSLWIADTLNTQIEAFPGGAYQDGAVVVSGISADETPVRILREVDFAMQYDTAAVVQTGVTIQ
jgi:HK97 family phage major capsid protein